MRTFLNILLYICFLEVTLLHAQSCNMDYGYEVQKIETGKISLSYVSLGKGNPVILVHGLGGHAGHWKMNMQAIADAGFRAIALNLPGYGESELHAGISAANQLKYYAAVIDTFVQTLKLDKVTMVGHSMGGQTALWVALSHPRWLRKLVLVAPAGLEVFSEKEAALLKNFATPEFFQQQDDAAIIASFRKNFHRFPDNAQALIDERIAFKTCEKFEAYTIAVSAGVQGMLGAPVATYFSKISIPVLLITGKEDALIPNRMLHPGLTMQQLLGKASGAFPHITIHEIADAGHMVQWEAHEKFNEQLKRFLKDNF